MSSFDPDYFAEQYGGDYLRRNPPRKGRALLDVIQAHRERGRLLDVGCALGAFLDEAAGYSGFELCGVDVSPETVAQAADRFGGRGVAFASGALPSLPFEDGAFDIVTAFDVVEHVPDRHAAIAELRRLLTPGGLLVVTVPVYDGPLGPAVMALDSDPTHLHKLGRKQWLQDLGQGFELLEWLGAFRYGLGPLYLHRLTRRLRSVAPALIVVAQRA